jgi:Ca2+-binding EF-hand superfamily protein
MTGNLHGELTMKDFKLLNHLCGALLVGGLTISAVAFAADAPGALSQAVKDEIRAMDANGDGKISAAEHAAGAKAMFVAMDANKDGIVTAAEMDAANRAKGGNASAGQLSSAEKIAVIDTNKDGKLSTVEHSAASRKMFEKMDKNKDGFVTAEEMQAGHDQMMKK